MEKKVCTKCKIEKETCEFFWKNKVKNKLHSQCKQCYKENRNGEEHYLKYRTEYIERNSKRRETKKKENRLELLEYLKINHCIDCGEGNPITLEFDHRDDSNKKIGISDMISSYNWETIKKEIDKCDVRCSNCHKIRTSKQFGWWYENIS